MGNSNSSEDATTIVNSIVTEALNSVSDKISNGVSTDTTNTQVMNVTVGPSGKIECENINFNQTASIRVNAIQNAVNSITNTQNTDISQALDNAMKDTKNLSNSLLGILNSNKSTTTAVINNTLSNVIKSQLNTVLSTQLSQISGNNQQMNYVFNGTLKGTNCTFSQDSVIISIIQQTIQNTINDSQTQKLTDNIKSQLEASTTESNSLFGSDSMTIAIILVVCFLLYMFFGPGGGSSKVTVNTVKEK